MRGCSTLILIAFLVTLPRVARADDPSVAREAYLRATRHYELGEFRQALDAFKEAYRSVPDPALLFDLGQCHRQLGEAAEAARAYRLYLVKLPGSPRRDKLLQVIDQLERAAAETRAAESAPTTPPPEAVAPAPPPPPTPLPPPPLVRTELRHAIPHTPTWLVFGTGGVGAAALVAAIALAANAQSLSDGERAKDPLLRAPDTAGQIRVQAASANGLFIGGGALLLATGVLALTASWRRHSSARPTAWVAPSGAGLAVVGRF